MGHSSTELAEKITWYCAVFLGIILVLNFCESTTSTGGEQIEELNVISSTKRGCDEIYVVGVGDTLQSISEKCDDPYIVEFNPHIHDPDDVFPGLLIKITPKFNNI
ncbi:LysM domain-containing protein [Heracleum sosnowskyi]|uniref:LysM domain-containing protein n=1 Tax=Heracleum sosnowskyi TaxID=360622 RepID=A0AAD8IZD2_9APIA|nr:LysM domain-containing protein [Heracleum sosnowskyi]